MSSKISKLEVNSLNEYVSLVEDSYFNSLDMHTILMSILKNVAQSKTERGLNLEIQCLLGRLSSGEYIPMFESKTEDGRVFKNPDIDSFTQEDLELIKKQLYEPRNHSIKASLAHILFIKKQGVNFAKQAIEEYLKSIDFFKILDLKYPNDNYGLEILHIFKNLEYLCLSINYNVDKVVDLAIDLAKTFNENSSSSNVIRINTIEFLLNKRNKIKIDNAIFKELSEICENYSSKKANENIITAFFELGSRIDKLLIQDTTKWDKKYAEYYEMLSTQVSDIQAPIYVQKAIDYYKKLKNNNKVNELNKKYSFLCQNIKLDHYQLKSYDLTDYINQYIELANKFNTEEIIKFLAYSSEMIPNYNKYRESAIESLSQNVFFSMCDSIILDKYGHNIDILQTDEEKLKHQIYLQYDIIFQIQSKLNFCFINKAIELKKLNANDVINFLEKTWFGHNFEIEINQEETFIYNWINLLKDSISSGFSKLEQYSKNNDYPLIFIQEVDSLVLKVEGIIRNLISISRIQGFDAFKFNCKNEHKLFVWKNINGYLYDSKLTELLPEDDIVFLRYFLIDKLNLRNNVAHCLLLNPNEYSVSYFEYLVIILLRLARFRINEVLQ